MISAMHKQQGAAAIYLVFLLVPLFGAIFLALEGTRYIQKQNRLADASEAGVLAITMANRGNTDSYESDLTSKYVQSYVRNIEEISELSVSMKEGEDTISDVIKPFHQYKINAKTTHQSWLSSLLIPSFSPVEAVVNQAIARNYPEITGDKYVDIVFVADFSSSMNNTWDRSNTKIDVLKDALQQVSLAVLAENGDDGKSKIGFVPFNMRTQRDVKGEKLCMTQLSYKDYLSGQGPSTHTPYDQVNWKKHVSELTQREFSNCWNSLRACNSVTKEELRTMESISGDTYDIHPDPTKYVDIAKTVADVFIDKINNTKLHPKAGYYSDNDLWSTYSCNADFYTVAMTEYIEDLNVINDMQAFGGTAVYQGIIQGAQLLQQEKKNYNTKKEQDAYENRIKMILILSDGVEDPYRDTFKQLVNDGGTGNGLCQKIKDEFSDGDVPLYMAVLGIQFDASEQLAFQQCVGIDNIVDVIDVDDLITEILEMIKKGAQTEGVTKLHYRNLN